MHFFLHFFFNLFMTGLSLTFGFLQIPVIHEIKQAWYTCEILFKYVIYLGYLSWAKVYNFIYVFDISTIWYMRIIQFYICIMIWLCISLSIKSCGFQNFLIKIDEPFIKLQIFYMHFFCISYVFLMYFLFISYAFLVHFLCIL